MKNDIRGPAATAIPGYRAGTWSVDPGASTIAFSVRQLGVKVAGRFTGFDLKIVTGDDPLESSVSASIDLASIDTGNPKRDTHVRSATFFDVDAHPSARYDSTGIRRAGDDWIVEGDLTLHGTTRAVPLTIAAAAFGPGRRATFSASARISRGDFGIDRWTGGGLVVSDEVPISFEIHAYQP